MVQKLLQAWVKDREVMWLHCAGVCPYENLQALSGDLDECLHTLFSTWNFHPDKTSHTPESYNKHFVISCRHLLKLYRLKCDIYIRLKKVTVCVNKKILNSIILKCMYPIKFKEYVWNKNRSSIYLGYYNLTFHS